MNSHTISMSEKSETLMIDVPAKFQGKWIAWDSSHAKVLASGDSLVRVREEAVKKGEPKPWLYKVPDSDEFYGGGAFVS